MDRYIRALKFMLKSEMNGMNARQQLLLIIIEMIVVFVPGIILLKKKKISLKRLLLMYLLAIYAGILLSFTVIRRQPGSRAGIVHFNIYFGFTLSGIQSLYATALSTLNVLLFIPWGMILCILFNDKNEKQRIFTTTKIGFLTSLYIEHTQLITGTGMFEVTDLVTNTLGSFIGALMVELTLLCVRKNRQNMANKTKILY